MDRPLRIEFAVSKQDYAKRKNVKIEKNVKEEIDTKENLEIPNKQKHFKQESKDAEDGRTLFIKNLPFETTNDELSELMSQYGPHEYALINRNPTSDYSKGTGFVRFKKVESAELCLSNSGKLQVKDFTLEFFPALSRTEAKKKHEEEKKKEPKDSRNLYLFKEGVIMAGSSAAEGVSASDMKKRLYLERTKKQMLKDLNRFFATDRLTVHNIPETYDDNKLRGIVKQHTKLNPKECRIMRENQPSPDYPKGKSKGFGFLSFDTHEHALQVLRKLNNNPNAWGKNNRPIISFSVEDRNALNLKSKRLEKSKQQNPTYQEKLEKEKLNENNIPGKFVLLKRPYNENFIKPNKKQKISNDSENLETFSGVIAKEGVTNFRSNRKMNEQSEKHMKNLTKRKKLEKTKKQAKEIQKEKQLMGKTKAKPKVQDDNLKELFFEYKKLFDNVSNGAKIGVKKRKWHENVATN